jgi:hypothetical protein
MPRTETETQLSSELSLSDFNFMESGNQPISLVYERVYETYQTTFHN